MSTFNGFFKQPDESLDFDFDFATWMPSGDSLASSVVTAETGITAGTKSHPGASVVKQFLSGGTHGTTYKVTCVITTTQGRVKEADIFVRVQNR